MQVQDGEAQLQQPHIRIYPAIRTRRTCRPPAVLQLQAVLQAVLLQLQAVLQLLLLLLQVPVQRFRWLGLVCLHLEQQQQDPHPHHQQQDPLPRHQQQDPRRQPKLLPEKKERWRL